MIADDGTQKRIPNYSLDELKSLYNLSVRCVNVCRANDLIDLKAIIDFYLKNKTFINLRNCGIITNEELIIICKDSIENYIEYSIENKESEKIEIKLEYTEINLDYLSKRHYLSNRSYNVCRSNNLHNLYSIIEYYNMHGSFKYLRNCGTLSNEELIRICIYYEEHYKNSAQSNDKVNTDSNNDSHKTLLIKAKINQCLDVKGENKKLYDWLDTYAADLIENHDIKLFLRLIHLCLNQYLFFNETKTIVFKHRTGYTNEEIKIYVELANELDLTRERIRQLHLKTPDVFWEKVKQLAHLFNLHNKAHIFSYSVDENEVLRIHIDEEIEQLFSKKFIYSLFLELNKNEFSGLYIDKELKYIIKSDIYNYIDFKNFFIELNSILNEKTDSDTEFSITGLIFENIKGGQSNYNYELFECINKFINYVIYNEYGLFVELDGIIIIPRKSKKKTYEYIEEILQKNNSPMTLVEIQDKLMVLKPDIDISIEGIRSTIIQNKLMFVLAGSSTYGLKKWEDEGRFISGSIVDIVEHYLMQFEEPKYVLEITRFVNEQGRITSEKSINTNLELSVNNRFVYYDNGFWGLKSKNYPKEATITNPIPNYWFKHLCDEYFVGNMCILPYNEIISLLALDLGIKKIQVEASIAKRIEKGDLILKENTLFLNTDN
jgi:uncharacterized protein YxjI